MSKPTLADQMYAAFRSNSGDPAALPAWGNMDYEARVPWMAAADRAEKLVIEQCAEKLDASVKEAKSSGAKQDAASEAHMAGVTWSAKHLRGHV